MKKIIFNLLAIFLFNGLCFAQLKVLSDGSTQGGLPYGSLRIETSFKSVDIGANNAYHTHFYTNAQTGFWFEKSIMLGDGKIYTYLKDLELCTDQIQRMKIWKTNGYISLSNNPYWVPSFKLDVDGNIGANHIQLNSDSRLKKDIKKLDKTKIEKLFELQGKEYHMNDSSLWVKGEKVINIKSIVEVDSNSISIIEPVDTSLNFGFIAQELILTYPELVKLGANGYYSIDYISLIPIIVEALKDQNNKILELDKKIKESGNNKKDAQNVLSGNTVASLGQNIPNPFTENTTIEFYLPTSVQKANFYVYDLQGKQVKSWNLVQRENGSITIHGSELIPGMYYYSIIADNEIVGTEKMVLTE